MALFPVRAGGKGWASEMTATATPLTLDGKGTCAWARRFARTTPGLVVVIAVAVAALLHRRRRGVCRRSSTAGSPSRRRCSTIRSPSPTRRRTSMPRPQPPMPPQRRRSSPAGPDTPDAGAVSAGFGFCGIRARRRDRRGARCRHPQGAGRGVGASWPLTRVWSKRREPTTRWASRSDLPTCARRRRRCRPSSCLVRRRSNLLNR